MTFDIKAWLNQPVKVTGMLGSVTEVPRHQRLCFLLVCNRGFRVTRWGAIGTNRGGHQEGLTQSEALDLIFQDGFHEGLCAAGLQQKFDDAFRPYWLAYITPLNDKASALVVKPSSIIIAS